MPAVLDMPKTLSKQEEFVEKQIEQARQRIRMLDWLSAGLKLLIVSFAFLCAILVIDHYVETPAGTGWAALAIYLAGAAGYLYLLLYRPSRRQINPYYAARRVEQTLTDAKNSVVNYVDLKDDEKVPGFVKTAIGMRAAKDLKHVDLNQVIQKKQVAWLAGFAGLMFAAAVVALFLPPTRTTLALIAPKGGNTTIVQGEDLRIEVELKGRIPKTSDPDAARVRLWYNPDDPASYEERILEPVEGQKRTMGLTIPAKQTRNGFQFKVLAGNAQSADFEVKVHIIPQFTGWTVEYQYPDYLDKLAGKTNDPNLVGQYGTDVTLTALTNRPVKSGSIEIDGQAERIIGVLLPDNPEAIVFRFPMLRNSKYRINFVTTDGQPNPSPQRYGITLTDPKPLFLNFDVTYDYPKYLRADPVTITLKHPDLEALRGTKVTLVGHANRPISTEEKKEAKVEFPGCKLPIVGEVDPKNPTQVKFNLVMLQDGDYRVVFTPKTGEKEGEPGVFKVRVAADEKPKVVINKPVEQETKQPANGTLAIEGEATDDLGLDKIILHMQVVEPANARRVLAKQPYRNGKSFRRETDGSYPTKIEYQDFVDLAKVKADGQDGAGFQLKEGMVVEYWLEAIDNCDVSPGPNHGFSEHKTVRIEKPVTAADMQKQKEQKQKIEQEQKQHEQKQDQNNAKEERKRPQPNPKGDQPPPQGDAKQENGPKKDGQPMPGNQAKPDMGDQPPMDQQDLDKQQEKIKEALNKAEKNNTGKPPMADPNNAGMPPMTDPKNTGMPPMTDPNNAGKPPMTDPKNTGMPPMTDPNNAGKPPMTDPNNAGKPPMTDPKNTGGMSTPQDLNDLAEKLDSKDPKEQEEASKQVQQMMAQNDKKPPNPEEEQKKQQAQRDKLDTLAEKQKFDQSNKRIQKEMEKLAQERQERKERVKNAADKAGDADEKKREEGQKDIENELKNPNTRDDVDQELQHLAKEAGEKDKTRQRRIDDARDLMRKKVEMQEQNSTQKPMPKNENEELAKKTQKGTPQEKQDARDKLEKKLSDPMQRDQVEKDLKNHADGLPSDEKKDFEKQVEQMKDNVAKKGQAKQPPPSNPQDVNKLAEDLQSKDEKTKEQARNQLRKQMEEAKKNPPNPQEQEKKYKDFRDKLTDKVEKDKFDDSMKQIGQEMQNLQREDRVKSAADKAKSSDPKEHAQGQKEIEQELQRQDTREQVEKQLQQLAGDTKDPKQKQNLEDARSLSRNNIKNQENANANPPPKKDDDDAAKLAKKMQQGTPQQKQEAQDKLEKKLSDPKQSEQVKKDLEKYKNDLAGDEKKDFEQKMQQMQDNIAKKDAGNKPGAEDIKKFANELANGSKQEKQEAQQQLEEAMKQAANDPKAGEQARQQIDQIRNNIKDQAKKDEFDQAIDKIDKAVAKQQQAQAQQRQADAEKMAKDLNSNDPATQKAAEQKLEQMLNDPKTKDAAKAELDKAKQNASPEAQKNIDKAVSQAEEKIAKKDPKSTGQPSKEEIAQLAKDLNSKDPAKQQAASQKLEQMLGDPKQQQAVKDELENIKKNTADQAAKQNIDNALKKAEENVAAKNGKKDDAAKLDPKDVAKLAEQLQSKNANDVKAAEKKIDEVMKDPAKRAALEKQLKEMLSDPKKRDEVQKAVNDHIKNEIDKQAQRLQSGTPAQQKQAGQEIEEWLKDPKNQEFLNEMLKDFKKNLKDDQARKDFDKKMKDLEDKLAKNEPGQGGDIIRDHNGKKPGDPGYEEPAPGSLADLKNKVRAGDLLLNRFKRNITNEEFRKDLNMSEAEIAAFLKKYEERVKALKEKVAVLEKGEQIMPRRDVASPLNGQKEKVRFDSKDSGTPNAGSKFTAPPGFGDPYRRFTDEVSGSAQPATPKK